MPFYKHSAHSVGHFTNNAFPLMRRNIKFRFEERSVSEYFSRYTKYLRTLISRPFSHGNIFLESRSRRIVRSVLSTFSREAKARNCSLSESFRYYRYYRIERGPAMRRDIFPDDLRLEKPNDFAIDSARIASERETRSERIVRRCVV